MTNANQHLVGRYRLEHVRPSPTLPEATIRTLVIIPAYNEAESLPHVLASLTETRPDLDIVVVDDGSVDATASVARAAGVTVLSLPFNLGIGGALRTGFRYAVREGYDRAVQFDADGQHGIAALPTVLDGLDEADLVIGSRFAVGSGTYQVSSARGLAMRSLQGLIRLLTGRRFSDTSSGLRGFSAPMLDFFARNYPTEYMESVEALLSALYGNFVVVEVPVTMHQREAGQASQARLKLAYHYIRVTVTLVAHAGRRPQPVLGGSVP